MNPSIQLVAFTLEGQTFAVELATVIRVIHAIEVTPLPHAPDVILGIINVQGVNVQGVNVQGVNVQGQLFSVVNLRHRFRMAVREIRPSDHFILVNLPIASPVDVAAAAINSPTITRKLALVVDQVTGIVEVDETSIVAGHALIPDLAYVQGVVQLADDLVLIHDLAQCLSLHEAQMLQDALTKLDNA